MTTQEFAGKIREKYPGAYDDMPDDELTQRVIAKYPVYKDQITDLPIEPIEMSLLQRATTRAGEIFSEGYQGIEKAITEAPSPLQAGLRTTGAVAETAGKLIAEPVITGVKGIADKLADIPIVQKIAESKFGGNVLAGAQDIFGRISGAAEQLKTTNPELYQDLKAAGEIGLLILGEKPAQKSLEVAGQTLKTGGETIFEVGARAGRGMVGGIQKKVGEGIGKVSGVVEKTVTESIPKPVESALRETSSKMFDDYVKVASNAASSFKAPTPLEVVGQHAQKALDTIQRKLNAIGEQKSGVMGQAVVGNKAVGNIVVKFRQSLNSYLKGKTAVEGDTKLIRDILTEAERLGNNPRAKDVDKFIDFIQDRIYTSQRDLTIPVTDQTTGALRKITGQLNESLKSQLPESYSGLNSQYAKIVEIRNELNLKLGKEGERGGALMKRVFSPSDAGTKQLFAEIKKLTGVDLVNEATLARFVMETIGDARQASLLEQLQLPKISPKGILDFLFQKLASKFNTPEARFERARQLTIE